MAEYDNEYMSTVEKLFWDWYQTCTYEIWSKEHYRNLNDQAQVYAQALKLDFPRDPKNWDAEVSRP